MPATSRLPATDYLERGRASKAGDLIVLSAPGRPPASRRTTSGAYATYGDAPEEPEEPVEPIEPIDPTDRCEHVDLLTRARTAPRPAA